MKLKLIAKNLIGFLLATTIFTTILMLNRSNASQNSELGGRWILTQLIAGGNEIDLSLKDRRYEKDGIVLDKEKRYMPHQLEIFPSCNMTKGSFTADDNGNFSIKSLFGTLFDCGEPHPMETAILKATKYSVENDVLTLRDETGENIAKFVRFKEEIESDAVWTDDF